MFNFHEGDAKIFVPTSSWDTAIADYEKASKEAETAGDWSEVHKWWLGPEASKATHIEGYWDHVLVAYNHGQVDGESTNALINEGRREDIQRRRLAGAPAKSACRGQDVGAARQSYR